MITRFMSVFGIALLLGAFGSCESNGGDGGKTLGALTSEEISSLCAELYPYYLRTVGGVCTAEGLDQAASLGTSCSDERASCIADSISECSVSKVIASQDAACMAVRVDDLRDCIKAGADITEAEYGNNVDCETGLKPSNAQVTHAPVSCERVAAACKELAGPSAESQNDGGVGADSGLPDADSTGKWTPQAYCKRRLERDCDLAFQCKTPTERADPNFIAVYRGNISECKAALTADCATAMCTIDVSAAETCEAAYNAADCTTDTFLIDSSGSCRNACRS